MRSEVLTAIIITKTDNPGPGLLYNLDPFVLVSLIPDDGGSTHF
jgi:hypothetical protein